MVRLQGIRVSMAMFTIAGQAPRAVVLGPFIPRLCHSLWTTGIKPESEGFELRIVLGELPSPTEN